MAKRKPSRFKAYVTQSVLVPKSHPEVREHGLAGAKAVAKRHGDHVGKPELSKNFYRFRQFDPKLASKTKYVTRSEGRHGVKVVSAPITTSVESLQLTHQRGACVTGAKRKRIVCVDDFAGHGIHVRARTTRKEHDKLEKEESLGSLTRKLSGRRLSVTTAKKAAGTTSLKGVNVIQLRPRAERRLAAVANPTKKHEFKVYLHRPGEPRSQWRFAGYLRAKNRGAAEREARKYASGLPLDVIVQPIGYFPRDEVRGNPARRRRLRSGSGSGGKNWLAVDWL